MHKFEGSRIKVPGRIRERCHPSHRFFTPCHIAASLLSHTSFLGYRTFCVDFNTDEVRHCLASSVFYLFPKKIKGGQNELVKSPKMIAMTALIRVISF